MLLNFTHCTTPGKVSSLSTTALQPRLFAFWYTDNTVSFKVLAKSFQKKCARLPDLAISDFAAAAVTLESEGIASNDNDTSFPTSAAVKDFVDTTVASDITLKGNYNASTNSPDLDTSPSGIVKGDHYVVSVAGTFFSESLQAGDSLIAKQDNPTTFAHWITVNNNAVTPIVGSNIAADAIDGTKIADDAINSEHITDGSIDLAHMSSESVDEDNLHISNSGSNGQFLSKQSGDAGGLTWATVSGYSAPTIGSTSIGSGATVSTIAGLTLTAPNLGTPSALVGTNISGTAANLTAGAATTAVTVSQAAQSAITSVGTLTGLTMGGAINMGGADITNGGVIFLTEQAEAEADVDGKVQIWLDTQTPNKLYFTDDAGNDTDLTAGGGATATHDYTIQAYNYSGGGADGTTRSVYVRPLKTSGGAEDTNNEGVFIKIKKNGTADTEVQIA